MNIYKSDIYPTNAICHNDWDRDVYHVQLNITIIVDKDGRKVIIDNDQDDWNDFVDDNTKEVIHLYPPGRIYNKSLKHIAPY